ncbi:peptidyl-prolyl cis-trans isomerase SurA [Aeromonas sp. BIGb0405]|uniref:peptidylprolyl isomerase SurA n=1 Tax=Aeromonas TaxID=642 RepID=UPI001CCD9E73|nr:MULTISPECIES: peptidylprolyl isomerase SurA [Aeromonas]MCS3454853.1 peptidyl-prolyl cis-trans isomerase SurA [Aeromonas sp. BIGb0405]MCS3459822.1 peptidyl-prolyl cis-trans isomerase SurA [Aeromonas sp. BIGb0445]UBO74925.1 peptidylprolyl isomerase SurA [Aeromonas rivuli]
MKKTWISLLTAGLLGVMSQSALASPELIDKVLAVVNKDVVLASQQEALVNKIKFSAKESGQALPDDATLRKQALDRLIQESLQLQLADRQGLKISDTQLEQAINSIAADNKMNLEQLRAQLDREGLSYAQYREEVRREILMNEVRRNQIRRRINISDQEVKQVVQALQKQGQQQQEFHVGHIQIALPDNPSTEQLNAAKAKIDSLLKRLRDGADFRELAIAESNGPKALEGGDWGWMSPQEMPTLMAEAVQGAKKGDIVGPLRSGAGLHIVKVFDAKGAQQVVQTEVKARHILIKPSIILSEEKAKGMLDGFLHDIKSGKADFAALAEKYSEDPGSAVQGGELGWSDPGVYVPEFRDMVNRLQPGQYSEPFRTSHGWHIVQLEDRRSQDATDKAQEQRAYQLIYNRRFVEESQAWLDELRDEAYIRIEGAGS